METTRWCPFAQEKILPGAFPGRVLVKPMPERLMRQYRRQAKTHAAPGLPIVGIRYANAGTRASCPPDIASGWRRPSMGRISEPRAGDIRQNEIEPLGHGNLPSAKVETEAVVSEGRKCAAENFLLTVRPTSAQEVSSRWGGMMRQKLARQSLCVRAWRKVRAPGSGMPANGRAP